MAHNVLRLFNIIYTPGSHSQSEILVSVDAKKVFDRVEWTYLFSVLAKFGFGPTIPFWTPWIKLLYALPEASVQTSCCRSEYFNMTRSTKQGCPLSPLLFEISIEPLAVCLRNCAEFSGVDRRGLAETLIICRQFVIIYIQPHQVSPSDNVCVGYFWQYIGI